MQTNDIIGLNSATDTDAPEMLKVGTMQRAGEIKVDREASMLRNVAFLTAGEAKNHPFFVDTEMLKQVTKAVNGDALVRVRLGHPGFFSDPEVTTILGVAQNASVVGNQVRGDIVLGKHASTMPGKGDVREWAFRVAEDMPRLLGLSVAFMPDREEMGRIARDARGGLPPGRIKELLGIDFVGDPGANPDGLLSRGDAPATAGVTKTQGVLTMKWNEKQLEYLKSIGLSAGADEDAVKTFVADLDAAQKDALTELAAGDTDEADANTDAAGKTTDAAGLSAGQGKEADKDVTTLSSGEPALTAESIAKIVKEGVKDGVEDELRLETKRQADITSLARANGLDDEFIGNQIKANANLQQATTAALAAIREGHQALHITVGDDLDRSTLAAGIGDAIMLRNDQHAIEIDKFDRVVRDATGRPKVMQLHDRAMDFRHMDLLGMGRAYLRSLGVPGAEGLSRPLVAECMMSGYAMRQHFPGIGLSINSTGDFPLILADVMGKTLRANYEETPRTWPIWVKRKETPDFKDVKRNALSEAANLTLRAEGASITYKGLSESREVYAVAEYAEGIILTRKAIINDDMSAFDAIPTKLAQAAARLEDTLVYAILTANPNLASGTALFDAATHKNLITVGAAPSTATLTVGRAAMRNQMGMKGDAFLNIVPRFIIAPVEHETTIDQLIRSISDPSSSNANVINVFQNSLIKVIEPRLSANSAFAWFLAADPNQFDTLELMFLSGEPAPVLKQKEMFDTDDMKFAVRHTCGAAPIDYRGLFENDGVA